MLNVHCDQADRCPEYSALIGGKWVTWGRHWTVIGQLWCLSWMMSVAILIPWLLPANVTTHETELWLVNDQSCDQDTDLWLVQNIDHNYQIISWHQLPVFRCSSKGWLLIFEYLPPTYWYSLVFSEWRGSGSTKLDSVINYEWFQIYPYHCSGVDISHSQPCWYLRSQ